MALPHSIMRLRTRVAHRDGMVFDALLFAWPEWLTAEFLMRTDGLLPSRFPLTPFVTFLHIIIRINKFLTLFGWQAVRTGGRPEDFYRLSEVGG